MQSRWKITDSSILLAVVYTLGHIFIAMNVVYWLTGASFFEAGLVALIEPAINGFWFYVLHTLWVSNNNQNSVLDKKQKMR